MSDVLVVDVEDPGLGLEELHDGGHRDEADQAQRLLLALVRQVLSSHLFAVFSTLIGRGPTRLVSHSVAGASHLMP